MAKWSRTRFDPALLVVGIAWAAFLAPFAMYAVWLVRQHG